MSAKHNVLHAAAFILVATLFGTDARAAPPVLMVLEHMEDGRPVQAKVKAIRGDAPSPSAGKEFARWIVRAGDDFKSDARPNEIAVEFFRGAPAQRNLLFTINIRYFRNADGAWTPHYQLNEIPLVTRDNNGRWRPLTSVPMYMLINTPMPNGEGFYPFLEFGLTAGTLQIDSWSIR